MSQRHPKIQFVRHEAPNRLYSNRNSLAENQVETVVIQNHSVLDTGSDTGVQLLHRQLKLKGSDPNTLKWWCKMHIFPLIQSEDTQGYPDNHLPIRQGVSVLEELSLDGQSKEETLCRPAGLRKANPKGVSIRLHVYSSWIWAVIIYGREDHWKKMCILTDLHDKVSLGGYRRQTRHSHYVKTNPHSYFQSIPKSVIHLMMYW